MLHARTDESWSALFRLESGPLTRSRTIAMGRLLILALLVSGLIIFAMAPSMLKLGPSGTEHWYVAGWIASTLVAGLLSFRVAAHLEKSACKAWRSFGLGCFCWMVAIVIWAGYGWAGADLKFPGSADFFFIGSNVFFAVGMFYYFLADSPGNRIQVTNFALALCSTIAAGYILYFPVLLNSDVGWFGEMVAFSYPAIGLSTWAFALICNRLYVRGEDSFAFLLIMVGLGAIAIANYFYGLDVLNEAYFVGTVYDIGWIAGFAFVAWAALEQGSSGDIADRPGASPKPTALRDQALVPAISTAAVLLSSVVHLWEEPGSGLAPLGILPFVVGLAACLAVREYSVVATERRLREEAEAAASQLANARERLTGVLASTTDGVMVLDTEWRVTFANKHAVATLFSDRTFLGVSLWELHPEAVGGKIDENYRKAMKHQTPVEFAISLSTGVWFEVHLYPTLDNLTVFFRDITERQQSRDELVRLAQHDPLTDLANRALFSERLALALESGRRHADLTLALIDLDDFKVVNDLGGHQAGDCLLQQFASRLAGLVREGDTVARVGGDEFAIIQPGPVDAEGGAGIARRISEALLAPFEIEGSQLTLSVSIGIAMAPKHGTRPKDLIRSADLALYRAKETKGTSLNYCIFDPGMDDHLQARQGSRLEVQRASAHAVQSALQAVAQVHTIDEHDLHVTASGGISIYPDDGDNAETLMKNADTAMYQAKDMGRQTYRFFKPAMNERAVERQSIEAELRRALEREELELHYQPKIDLATGLTSGAEALIRWNHPTRGLISPAQFIPIAEDCRLILPIGEWVLGEACRQAQRWAAAGVSFGTMAVNVSAVQFREHNFAQRVFAILGEAGMDPKRLELELTESVLMTGAGSTASTLQTLRSKGVQVALDDFGTGYSSLSYLQRFPVDCLKIDQSFIRQISGVGAKNTLVTAIINMAHTLELRVVAEGVETKEELQFIRDRGCDEGQGYYFSRPLTSSAFAARLAEQDRTMAPSCSPPVQSRPQARSTQSFGRSPEGATAGKAKLLAIQGLATRHGGKL